MKVIKDVCEDIEQILDKAEDYIKKAILYQTDFPAISKVYYNKSIARMNDIKDFHDQIVIFINSYRQEKGEPPAPMMAIYNYLHERQINMTTAVRALQESYK